MNAGLTTPNDKDRRVSASAVPCTTDMWLETARADYRLCRRMAVAHHARLERSLRSQRVGWELFGFARYALLLPDALPGGAGDEWYCYYPTGESCFRRTRAERERQQMIVLAESVDDWAELLRQALADRHAGLRYEVSPTYINAFGDIESTPTGCRFELWSCPPPQGAGGGFVIAAGTGETPEGAARAACARWLGMDPD